MKSSIRSTVWINAPLHLFFTIEPRRRMPKLECRDFKSCEVWEWDYLLRIPLLSTDRFDINFLFRLKTDQQNVSFGRQRRSFGNLYPGMIYALSFIASELCLSSMILVQQKTINRKHKRVVNSYRHDSHGPGVYAVPHSFSY